MKNTLGSNRMSLIELISLRLIELRHIHGLTQEEAAELIGISTRFYQTFETGRKKHIWLATIERLAAAFGMEPWQLLFPTLAAQTKLQRDVVKSSIHNQRHRKGPYQRRQRETSQTEQCQALGAVGEKPSSS